METHRAKQVFPGSPGQNPASPNAHASDNELSHVISFASAVSNVGSQAFRREDTLCRLGTIEDVQHELDWACA